MDGWWKFPKPNQKTGEVPFPLLRPADDPDLLASNPSVRPSISKETATGGSPPTSLPVEPGAEALTGDGLPSSSPPRPPPNASSVRHRGRRRRQDLGRPHPDLARRLPLQVSPLLDPLCSHPQPRRPRASPVTWIAHLAALESRRSSVPSLPDANLSGAPAVAASWSSKRLTSHSHDGWIRHSPMGDWFLLACSILARASWIFGLATVNSPSSVPPAAGFEFQPLAGVDWAYSNPIHFFLVVDKYRLWLCRNAMLHALFALPVADGLAMRSFVWESFTHLFYLITPVEIEYWKLLLVTLQLFL